MAITKTKEQIYEWFTKSNWWTMYEREFKEHPGCLVLESGCRDFKEYLDFAFHKLQNESSVSYIEFLLCPDCIKRRIFGSDYWSSIDNIYWYHWVQIR